MEEEKACKADSCKILRQNVAVVGVALIVVVVGVGVGVALVVVVVVVVVGSGGGGESSCDDGWLMEEEKACKSDSCKIERLKYFIWFLGNLKMTIALFGNLYGLAMPVS